MNNKKLLSTPSPPVASNTIEFSTITVVLSFPSQIKPSY
jgi:hypothetical protein